MAKQSAKSSVKKESQPVIENAIGIKAVQCWQEQKDGKEGYAVKYPDGYVSWSPKEVFDKAYIRVTDFSENSISENISESIGAPNTVCASHAAGIICKWIGDNLPE